MRAKIYRCATREYEGDVVEFDYMVRVGSVGTGPEFHFYRRSDRWFKPDILVGSVSAVNYDVHPIGEKTSQDFFRELGVKV